jgi:hypothetical protein
MEEGQRGVSLSQHVREAGGYLEEGLFLILLVVVVEGKFQVTMDRFVVVEVLQRSISVYIVYLFLFSLLN